VVPIEEGCGGNTFVDMEAHSLQGICKYMTIYTIKKYSCIIYILKYLLFR